MTKAKNTKKALWISVVSLLLCVAMLIGTTFAWFTDSVTSANNIIKSGNLDITLEYLKDGEWVDVKDQSDILTNTLWEPGATEVAYFRIANAGSLALKYRFGINIVSEKAGVNKAGETFKLSDYIQFGVVENVNGETAKYENREDAIGAVIDAKKISAGYTKADAMVAGDEKYLALVVYMPTSVGNEANHKTGTDAPQIDLGINIFATQYTYEEDSFDADYDKSAPWTGTIDIDWYLDDPDAAEYVLNSAEELAGLAAIVNGTAVAPVVTYAADATATIKDDFKGQTIKLGANIDLNDLDWTPIGKIGQKSTDFTYAFKGNFDGQAYTVSNLNVSNSGWAGLFGIAHSATISNVTVAEATILSNRMAGAVVGQIYGSIDNCHVKNATVIATPNVVGDSYDNGDKVGGIVGWLGDNGNNRTLTNCSAENVELGAYRDVGGIVGYVASSTTVKNNTVANVEITVDQSVNYYGDKDVNAGYICGRVNGTIVEENNSKDEASVVDSTYSKNGMTLKSDGDGNVKLYLVPETYEGATLTVPEGVTAIGNYAFAYNANVETVVLASTVRDLGRGFDSSTVKKVVLNEGLTTISSRAFRRTYNLEEVVISSTVTTVADNAFQSSGIKEIVFPESVNFIGDSCFTGATVEKVTIQGASVEIAHYAFRDCPNLTEVNILSDSITLGSGMIFANSQDNNANPNNITITVRNEEVKAAIVNNGTFKGVIVVDDGFEKVESAEALLTALSNATAGAKIDAMGVTVDINSIGTEVAGGKKEYTIPGDVTIKNLIFTGTYRGGNYIFFGGTADQKIVFENCTFDLSGRTMGFGFLGQEGCVNSVEYNNCTFKGAIILEFPGNPNGVATYNNCTFTRSASGNNYVMAKGGTHLFNSCTFDYTGSTQSNMGIADTCCINVTSESDGSDSTEVVLDGCTRINCSTRKYGANSTLTIK